MLLDPTTKVFARSTVQPRTDVELQNGVHARQQVIAGTSPDGAKIAMYVVSASDAQGMHLFVLFGASAFAKDHADEINALISGIELTEG
jgi:hypothetical protein